MFSRLLGLPAVLPGKRLNLKSEKAYEGALRQIDLQDLPQNLE